MADTQGMAEHHAGITVSAPVHQVYQLFTHFNDFPKFMSFVKEVTYYDEQRSHWVAEVVGRHEWDAVNDNWIEDRQIGWHSTNGLENLGRVTFQQKGTNMTQVDVYVNYNPPAGVIGDIGENLGVGNRFDSVLQHDMDNFARMVDEAPPGALDPTSSNYLFHSGSAAAKGATTSHQDETMNPNLGQTSASGSDHSGAVFSDTAANPTNQNYDSNTGYTDQMQNPMQNPNSPISGSSLGTGYTDATVDPNDPGYGKNVGSTDPTMNPSNPSYDTTSSTGSGYGDPAMNTSRPILDQDIINEDVRNTPNYSGTQNDVIYPDSDMPPEKRRNYSGTQEDVMPPKEGTQDLVLPPDQSGTGY